MYKNILTYSESKNEIKTKEKEQSKIKTTAKKTRKE